MAPYPQRPLSKITVDVMPLSVSGAEPCNLSDSNEPSLIAVMTLSHWHESSCWSLCVSVVLSGTTHFSLLPMSVMSNCNHKLGPKLSLCGAPQQAITFLPFHNFTDL